MAPGFSPVSSVPVSCVRSALFARPRTSLSASSRIPALIQVGKRSVSGNDFTPPAIAPSLLPSRQIIPCTLPPLATIDKRKSIAQQNRRPCAPRCSSERKSPHRRPCAGREVQRPDILAVQVHVTSCSNVITGSAAFRRAYTSPSLNSRCPVPPVSNRFRTFVLRNHRGPRVCKRAFRPCDLRDNAC